MAGPVQKLEKLARVLLWLAAALVPLIGAALSLAAALVPLMEQVLRSDLPDDSTSEVSLTVETT